MEPSFIRGLPDDERLKQHPLGATYLRELLKVCDSLVYPSVEVPEGAKVAHSQGWVVFIEQKPMTQATTIVRFPSPFHKHSVSWILGVDLGCECRLNYCSASQVWQFEENILT